MSHVIVNPQGKPYTSEQLGVTVYPATPAPADWADQLALDICADMAGRQHTEARSLIAARLRLVKAEGERDGISAASCAISGALHEITS